VTGEPLTTEDLIGVKINKTVKPRPVTATSIPSMLQLFQNEWDALMLETYTLKQHLETVRQELAHALYQHDAACRVIARLIKERDAAKAALGSFHGQVLDARNVATEQGSAMEVEATNVIPDAVKEKLSQKSAILSKDRKKRQISPNLAQEDAIKEYTVQSSDTGLHKTSPPGISCLDIHPSKDLIATGGLDSDISVFNTQTRKIVAKLSGHSKRINDVAFHPTDDLIFSCSQDRTVRVWQSDGEGYTAAHTLRTHTDDVVGISLHATGDYLASASHDKSWAFHDIRRGTTLTKIQDPTVTVGFSSIAFHPDGLILGTGTKDNAVRIWDVKAQTNVATFEGHTAPVEGLSFSENGYHLATAGGDSVKLWDLRKLTNFHNIPLTDVHSAAFDVSGQYLIVSHANSVSIFGGKAFTPIKTFTDSNAKVTDAKFGKDALSFATTSLDRSLKLYG
jgi:pre-mRNA-processing factor 19